MMPPSTVHIGGGARTIERKKRKACILGVCILGTILLLAGLICRFDREYTHGAENYNVGSALRQDDDDSIDDDARRDDVCKAYLMKFLNGTTDARDECEGMLNAYQAGDCRDFGGSAYVIVDNDDDTDNNNRTDDDVLIDDAYEAWECCSSIYKYYTAHCHVPELASFQLLGIVLVLVLCGLVKSLIQTLDIMWIPDAAACILVGATVGGTITFISPKLKLDSTDQMSFNNNLFLHILLPPIVFCSSLKIDKRAFWRHVGPILILAIVGTVLSAVLIGCMTFGLTQVGRSTRLPLLDSLLFGSLASSIDPVATLGILDAVGFSRTDTLYALVFGESLLNDGVAIVLFEALVRHVGDFRSRATLKDILWRFLEVSGGSVAIGAACGFLCMLYYLALRNRHTPVMEVAMFFCWALVPYYISDALGLSGIISIMTTGFVLDYYVIGGCQSEEAEWMEYMEFECLEASTLTERRGNRSQPRGYLMGWLHKIKHFIFSGKGSMSTRSSRHVGFVSEVVATIMETAIFAYLGVFLFSDKYNVQLNATAVASCVVSRAIMVLVVSIMLNFIVWLDLRTRLRGLWKHFMYLCRTGDDDEERDDEESTVESSVASTDVKVYLTRDTQLILFLSGVRGAVSFALVENIPVYNALTRRGSQYKAELKAMTSSSILFTLFVFGAATYFRVQQTQRRESLSAFPDSDNMTERLLSRPLASSDDDDDENNSGDPSSFTGPTG